MNILFKCMAIVLSLVSGLQAMEVEDVGVEGKEITLFNDYLSVAIVESEQGQTPQEHKRINLTPTEKENAYRMWLLKQVLEKWVNEGTLPWVPQDVQNFIGGYLHELSANPVLDGELVYTGKAERAIFKIRALIKKGGCIDLSDRQIFEDTSDNLLITIDPARFFNVDNKSMKLLILIAPKFLIEEQIDSTAMTFIPIMEEWKVDIAPIGIFYRMERWNDLNCYDYLTSCDVCMISKNNLYANRLVAAQPHGFRYPYSVISCGIVKNFMFNLSKN